MEAGGNRKVNGRKRHVFTDSPWLIWGVVVGAANEPDGTVARKVVEPLLGYQDRMKKILADHDYRKNFVDWAERNIIGTTDHQGLRPVEVEVGHRKDLRNL